ncbi:MAG: anti-sigma factor antagonist [Clostridia bacterium]|nr:anti-sigma factor antagonist [Clostridia bacterium]
MKTEKNGTALILYPTGRIDSTNAPVFQKEIMDALHGNPVTSVALDFDQLEYISSPGLRVLLMLSKKVQEPLVIRNASPEVYDILEVTGFTSFLKAERKLRRIDITGCEIIGHGGVSTVYRIDPDTIVKVYDIPNALEMIRNEQRRAKQALLKGIPTAISYDAVRVGDGYGSVFELVNARTFADLLSSEPDRMDELIRRHAAIIRKLHSIEAEPGELPDCRDIFLNYLKETGDVIPRELREELQKRLNAMPMDLHLIHGDLHLKNVMQCGDEPLLIDMDTLSTGNPVFDLANLYVAYQAFTRDDPRNSEMVIGIPERLCHAVWEKTLAYCIEPADEDQLPGIRDRIRALGYVRFLYLVAVLNLGGEQYRETRIRRSIEALQELVPRVPDFAV